MVIIILFINAFQNWFFRKIIYQYLKVGDICILENHWLYHNCVTYLIHLFLENYKLCNFMGSFTKIAFLIQALYRFFLLLRAKSTAERKKFFPNIPLTFSSVICHQKFDESFFLCWLFTKTVVWMKKYKKAFTL